MVLLGLTVRVGIWFWSSVTFILLVDVGGGARMVPSFYHYW